MNYWEIFSVWHNVDFKWDLDWRLQLICSWCRHVKCYKSLTYEWVLVFLFSRLLHIQPSLLAYYLVTWIGLKVNLLHLVLLVKPMIVVAWGSYSLSLLPIVSNNFSQVLLLPQFSNEFQSWNLMFELLNFQHVFYIFLGT